MEILGKYGKEDLATLYIAKQGNNIVEFVESLQPPIPREEKWVLILSTMYGCPMKCLMCDAGEYYHGNLTKEQIFEQTDYMIKARYPDFTIPVNKFKIQFARMGEPALNDEVLEALKELPQRYNAKGLMPCLSTIAPKGATNFLIKLIEIKDDFYSNGNFQLQFSIHSTDEKERRKWLPDNIWTLEEINEYGERWFKEGDRKLTLNFALTEDSLIDPDVIAQIFSPEKFMIKMTPMNPTYKAQHHNLNSGITEENADSHPLLNEFKKRGFDSLISIGDWEENKIGSNCGQFATHYMDGKVLLKPTYQTKDFEIKEQKE